MNSGKDTEQEYAKSGKEISERALKFVRKHLYPITPFVWFYAEDMLYYTLAGKLLHRESKSGDNGDYCYKTSTGVRLLVLPDEDTVRRLIARGVPISVLAPYPPFGSVEGIFAKKRLPNLGGALTSQELSYLHEEENFNDASRRLTEQKLRLKIHIPSLKLKDLRGLSKLKEQIQLIVKTIDDPLLRLRGVFLVGIPGTGKSYSAKCTAGELGRWLIEMNLSKILEDDRPIDLLHKIFEFIETIQHPTILWIDEVDKVFVEGDKERKLMGQMLTILEEFNKPTGYKADSFFWVTANDVARIVMKNPEFFRRFDYLFFMETPKREEVFDIFKMYFDKYGVLPLMNGAEDNYDIASEFKTMISIIETEYREFLEIKHLDSDRFIYTPAEIERVVKKCATRCRSRGQKFFTKEDLQEVVKLNRPIAESMVDAIKKMREQRKFFIVI